MLPQGLKSKFLQQSTWMVFGTGLGGVLLYAIHIPIIAKVPPGHYSVFAALLQFIHLMMIPSLALQAIFTEQTASAVTDGEQAILHRTAQGLLKFTALLWLVGVGIAIIFHQAISHWLQITQPAALWLTIGCGLTILWLPVMQGVMQGRDNFLWLGWGAILNGLGRFVLVLICLLFRPDIVGVMAGVFLGMVLNLALGAWQSWPVWWIKAPPIPWRLWLRKVIPLTLGLGAAQIMFCADMVIVQGMFNSPEKTDLYGFAGTIARGLVILTAPLVGVMFPKVVASAARAEKTNVLAQALGATGLLVGGAALGCTLFPELPIRLLNKPQYLPAAGLIPWFCWSMVPLVFGTVLVSNLMARRQFASVPWLCGAVVAYLVTLQAGSAFYLSLPYIEGFKRVIWTIGFYNLLFMGIALGFTLRTRRSP